MIRGAPHAFVRRHLHFRVYQGVLRVGFFGNGAYPAPPVSFARRSYFLPERIPAFRHSANHVRAPFRVAASRYVRESIPRDVARHFDLYCSFGDRHTQRVSLRGANSVLFYLPIANWVWDCRLFWYGSGTCQPSLLRGNGLLVLLSGRGRSSSE